MNFALMPQDQAYLPTPTLQRARGIARIGTQQRDGRTCLKTLFQEGCCKIRMPKTHSSALEAVFINTAGGITGGDHLQWGASVAPQGRLVVTTQACERSYRSTGDTAHVHTRLRVGAGAHLDWLPQETILFEASKLDRQLDIHLEEDATLTAIEAVLLGRDAMGEQALSAEISDNWRIRRNGRLVHAEATRIRGGIDERQSLSLLAGNRAFASVVHIAHNADAAEALLRRVRARDGEGMIGASTTGERLVVRAMAQTGLALRRLLVPTLVELTGAGALPRLWHL
ncbi:urease accessory protein [Devosia crocina]|uniref:Urease accessory protein UreD n=2 Tax=Devosia crocina TaxID=429728 RepID=A0A1I7N6I0_9HYPH|nr:urease accessory protein [Devosia crocina]